MRYDFSAQFLRVLPPDTSFAEAWESLCHKLLCLEHNDPTIIRLHPPDKGIDILHRANQHAFQCKSDERGAFGSLSGDSSIDSLRTALSVKETVNWTKYSFCTNANYTGTALNSILEFAQSNELDTADIAFLCPEYWDQLCNKHKETVQDRFDYRLAATVDDVRGSLIAERYYPQYVEEFQSKIEVDDFHVVITNNRTPIEISIPFSSDLTIKNCMDVARQLLGVSLEWNEYPSLGTTSNPSVSMYYNNQAQPLGKKLSDVPVQSGDKLELWIKINWRKQEPKDNSEQYIHYDVSNVRPLQSCLLRNSISTQEPDIGKATISATEASIQGKMWDAARRLRKVPNALERNQ